MPQEKDKKYLLGESKEFVIIHTVLVVDLAPESWLSTGRRTCPSGTYHRITIESKLHTALKLTSHQCRAERCNHLLWPTGHTVPDAPHTGRKLFTRPVLFSVLPAIIFWVFPKIFQSSISFYNKIKWGLGSWERLLLQVCRVTDLQLNTNNTNFSVYAQKSRYPGALNTGIFMGAGWSNIWESAGPWMVLTGTVDYPADSIWECNQSF